MHARPNRHLKRDFLPNIVQRKNHAKPSASATCVPKKNIYSTFKNLNISIFLSDFQEIYFSTLLLKHSSIKKASFIFLLGDAMKQHNNMKFTTKDQKNDLFKDENCAVKYQSAWWFNSCYGSNLNGMYNNQTFGIKWMDWKNEYLPRVEIKIRPNVT